MDMLSPAKLSCTTTVENMFDDENEEDDLFLSDIGSLSQIYDEKPNYNKNFSSGSRHKKRMVKHSIPYWDHNRKDGFVGEKKCRSTSLSKGRTFGKDDYDRIPKSSGDDDLSVKNNLDNDAAPTRDKYISSLSSPPERNVTRSSSPSPKSSRLDLYDDEDEDAVVLPEQNDAFKQIRRTDMCEDGFSQAKNIKVDRLYDEFELSAADQNKINVRDDEGVEASVNRPAKSLSDSLSDLIRLGGMEDVPWRKNKTIAIGQRRYTVDQKSNEESKYESCNDKDEDDRDDESIVEKQAFGKWLDKEYSRDDVRGEEAKVDLFSRDRDGSGVYSHGDHDDIDNDDGGGYSNSKQERTNELLDENYPNTNHIIDISYLYTKHKPMKISLENNCKTEEKTYSRGGEKSVVPYLNNNKDDDDEDDVVILEDGIGVRNSKLLKLSIRRSVPNLNVAAAVNVADSTSFLENVVSKAAATSRSHFPSSNAITVSDQKIPVLSLPRSVVEPQPAIPLPSPTLHRSDATSPITTTFAVPHAKQSAPSAPVVTSVSAATVPSSSSLSSLPPIQPSFSRGMVGVTPNHHHVDHSLISGPSMFADSHPASPYSDPVFVSRNPPPPPPATNFMNPFQQNQSNVGVFPPFTGSALNRVSVTEFFHNHPTANVSPYPAYPNPLSQPQPQLHEWMPMNPPAPNSHSVADVSTVPGESATVAKPVHEDAVKEEIRQQNKELMAQRDQYYEKFNLLGEELDKLKRQKKDLMEGKKSHQTEQFLRENNRLQNEIQNKIKAVRNVIDMLSKIIKDERGSKFENMDEKFKKSPVDGSEPKERLQSKTNSKERGRSKRKYLRSRSKSRHRSRSRSTSHSRSRSRSRSRGKRSSSSSKRSRSQHRGRSKSRGRSSSSRRSHSPKRHKRKGHPLSTDKHYNERRSPHVKGAKKDSSKKSDKVTASSLLPLQSIKNKELSKTTLQVTPSTINNNGKEISLSPVVPKARSEQAADQSGRQSLPTNSHYLKYYSEKFKPFPKIDVSTAAHDTNQASPSIQKKKRVNYVYYDPEIHWCSACNVFPKTAKEYLTHLHSNEHKNELTKQNLIDYPWHKTQPEMKNTKPEEGTSQRVPIRGLPFFVSATAWYCKLCDEWMGDLHCASAHLKSDLHAEKYQEFINENLSWEECWLRDRHRAQEQFLLEQQRLLFTCAVPPSHPQSKAAAVAHFPFHRDAKAVKAKAKKQSSSSSSSNYDDDSDNSTDSSSSSSCGSTGASNSSSADGSAQIKSKKAKKLGKSSSERKKTRKRSVKKAKSMVGMLELSSKTIAKAAAKNTESLRMNDTTENSENENAENDKFVDEWMNPARNACKGKELLELKNKIKKKEADAKNRRYNDRSYREDPVKGASAATVTNDTVDGGMWKSEGNAKPSVTDNKFDEKSVVLRRSRNGRDGFKRGRSIGTVAEVSNAAITTTTGGKKIFKFPFIGKMPSRNLKKNELDPKSKARVKGAAATTTIKSAAINELTSSKPADTNIMVTIQKHLEEYDKAYDDGDAEFDSCNTAVVDMDINEDEDEPVSIVIDDNDNRRKDFEETLKILYPEERKDVDNVHAQQCAKASQKMPQLTFQGLPYNLTQDYLVSLIESTLIEKLKLKLPSREADPSSAIVDLAASMQQALFTSGESTVASMTAVAATAISTPTVTTVCVAECGGSSMCVPVKSVTPPVSLPPSILSIPPSSSSSYHFTSSPVVITPKKNDARSSEEPIDDVKGEQSRNTGSDMTEAGHKKKKNPISQKKRRHLRKIREKLEEQEKQLQEKIEETQKNINETDTEIGAPVLPIGGINSDLILLGIEEGDSAALQF